MSLISIIKSKQVLWTTRNEQTWKRKVLSLSRSTCCCCSSLFELMFVCTPDVVSVLSSARSICLLAIDKQWLTQDYHSRQKTITNILFFSFENDQCWKSIHRSSSIIKSAWGVINTHREMWIKTPFTVIMFENDYNAIHVENVNDAQRERMNTNNAIQYRFYRIIEIIIFIDLLWYEWMFVKILAKSDKHTGKMPWFFTWSWNVKAKKKKRIFFNEKFQISSFPNGFQPLKKAQIEFFFKKIIQRDSSSPFDFSMNYIDKKIFLNPLAMISSGKKKGNHTKKKDLANIFSFKHILPRSFSFLMYIKKKGSEIIANTRFFDFSGLSDSRLFSSVFLLLRFSTKRSLSNALNLQFLSFRNIEHGKKLNLF